MKTLRFRAVQTPDIIRCGSKSIREADGIYPVHFIWSSNGGQAEVHVMNLGDRPIKVKVFVDGVLTSESPYFGNTSYQSALDSFNTANYHPIETIVTQGDYSTVASAVNASSMVDIKIYCPLVGSNFEFHLNCF